MVYILNLLLKEKLGLKMLKLIFSDSNYTSGSGIFISYAKQNVIFDNSNITVTNTKGNGLDFSGTVTFRNNSKINVNSSGGAAGVKGNKKYYF